MKLIMKAKMRYLSAHAIRILFMLCLLKICVNLVQGQTAKVDLLAPNAGHLFNREARTSEDGSIELNAKTGEGMMVLKDVRFAEGTIRLKIKGENKPGSSFVGIAFNISNEKTYEAIYFRPFNFKNKERETHAIQYVSMPDHPWELLRSRFPDKYENKLEPAPDPDSWLDVKIVVEGKVIRVFVNEATTPSLEVTSLSNTPGEKAIALWVGNNSKGSFKELSISKPATAISYGNNPQAGKYFDAGDAKLYYEVYGSGEPIVLLHGGVFGYISEFSQLITDLSVNYQVICLATRGHGKSEIGTTPFTYKQRAEDAAKLIRSITKDSITVLGFSDGGYSGYKLAAIYPALVKKLVVIGAGHIRKGSRTNKFNYTSQALLKDYGDLFKARMSLMPQPQRWSESLNKLNTLYNSEYMDEETFSRIKCPVLVMAGDNDAYVPVREALKAKELIANSWLSIIPGCGHVVFFCKYDAVREGLKGFQIRF